MPPEFPHPDSAAPLLIASDLDGTLLTSEGEVSERTDDVVRRAVAGGTPFIAVTGRPIRWMGVVVDLLDCKGVVVCSNGAVLYDMGTDSVLTAHTLAADSVIEIAHRLRKQVPDVTFAIESLAHGFSHEPAYRKNAVAGVFRPVDPQGPLEELVDDHVVKMLCLAPSGSPERFAAVADSVAGDLAIFTHSTSAPFLEVSAPGVTKASTLAALVADRGLTSADVVAFGDMPNDVDMLRWAGRSWATANAHRDAQAAANHLTTSNDDDGVALVLETWF